MLFYDVLLCKHHLTLNDTLFTLIVETYLQPVGELLQYFYGIRFVLVIILCLCLFCPKIGNIKYNRIYEIQRFILYGFILSTLLFM